MQKLLTVAVAVLMLGVAGCFSSGNVRIMDEAKATQVKEGLTREEVRALIGEPMGMSTTSGIESWSYMYMESHANAASYVPVVGLFAGGAQGQSSMILLVFDANGKVKTVTRSHSTSQIKY